MKDLSIVIPCYNEERVILNSMEKIRDLLSLSKLNYEIIMIDDKSKDRTREYIRALALEDPRISYSFHTTNQGRGATVTEGIRKANGRVVGYIDIDLEISETNILSHYIEIMRGSDVTYAERSISSSFILHPRTLLHSLYVEMIKLLFHTPFNDLNAGCKFFNRQNILNVLEYVEATHWFWDTEILLRSHRAGLSITKIPTIYVRNTEKKSTVKVFRDTVYFFRKALTFARKGGA